MAESKQGIKVVDGAMATKASDAGLKKASIGASQQHIDEVRVRYDAERDKRLRSDGLAQYIDVYDSPKFRHFQTDPWAKSEPKSSEQRIVKDGDEVKFFIIGAGFAGLCAGVRLRQAGVSADDILIVDSAGGFGGTWYWNRYPGLACDLESYIYLPMLEETGYVPKNKYSYGPEIREYINLLADKYDLRRNSIFETDVKSSNWDEGRKRWMTTIQPSGQETPIHVASQYVALSPGLLSLPKIPDVPGLEEYKGTIFHTSRWDYELTGGTEAQPDMTNLKDKSVAMIGTGATAIQAVPHLAKWAKKLYVIQRTPSAVDWRGQHQTDPEKFRREVATGRNWQYHRHNNFCAFLSLYPDVPKVNLVGDAWTQIPSLKTFVGGAGGPKEPSKLDDYLAHLHEIDFERQERVRKRVDEIVKDPKTAEGLKPWYAGWCKRPTFNDDYLPSFNQGNVELVDTGGKGITGLTKTGIQVNGRELHVDVIILGTGYRNPGTSICKRSNLTVKGRGGLDLDEKFDKNWNTLHGLLSKDFPNIFIFQLNQWSAGANYTSLMDKAAEHMVHIVTTAEKNTDKAKLGKLTVEPTAEAEKEWGDAIASRAMTMSGTVSCTPGYYNAEGQAGKASPEQAVAGARKAPWGEGWPSFIKRIENWESEGKLEGLVVTA